MATPNPFPGGGRRPRPADRLRRTMFTVVAFGAIAGAPVATVSLWLLLTDPALASEVVESGLTQAAGRVLLFTLGKAIAALLAFL